MCLLKLHLADGSTLEFDARDDATPGRLVSLQDSITAATLVRGRVPCSISKPRGFSECVLELEHKSDALRGKEAERLILYAGDVRLIVTAHYGQPSFRLDLHRIGRRTLARTVE